MVPEEITAELVPVPERTLFRTDDPAEVLEIARSIAGVLKGALADGAMVQRIGRNEHVKIEGWQTVGAMLGVTPHVVWSRPVENGWEARAEARTVDGRTIAAAEAMCTHAERNWRTSDEYQLRSMAQTRAMSKALSGPLRFIVTLAGFAATPAEEVGEDPHPYGPPAGKAHVNDSLRAAGLLTGSPDTATALMLRLEQDAGGYLPRIVARAVMIVAAHRPAAAATATGEAGPEASGTGETIADPEATPPDSAS